jgi:diaminopimelate epimerase
MQTELNMLKYVVIDAAGNVVLLIDAGATPPLAHGDHVQNAVAFCEGTARIDIVGFVSRIDGAVTVSFWNPDGTHERMCGNACRSIPLALQTWLGAKTVSPAFTVETEFCPARISLDSDGMSSVEFPINAILKSSCAQTSAALVDVGTPHAVREVEELFCDQIDSDGERLSTARTPVNATFCKVTSTEILTRTFERGVGETKSCGTGAIAATLALDGWRAIDHLPNPRRIRFASGEVLTVTYGAGKQSIAVSGKCELIASGVLSLGLVSQVASESA